MTAEDQGWEVDDGSWDRDDEDWWGDPDDLTRSYTDDDREPYCMDCMDRSCRYCDPNWWWRTWWRARWRVIGWWRRSPFQRRTQQQTSDPEAPF